MGKILSILLGQGMVGKLLFHQGGGQIHHAGARALGVVFLGTGGGCGIIGGILQNIPAMMLPTWAWNLPANSWIRA